MLTFIINLISGGGSRNFGLKHIKGKYVLFLDADDLFEANLVELAVNKIRKNNCDICIYRVDQFFECSDKIEDCTFAFNKANIPNKDIFSSKDFYPKVFNTFQNWTWNKLFSVDFIKNNNISFQEIMKTNDFYFVAQCLLLAKKITTLDKILVHYRKHSSSTQATNYLLPLEFLKAFDAVERFIKTKSLWQDCSVSFLNHKLSGCVYNLFSLKNEQAFSDLYHFLKLNSHWFTELDPDKCYFKRQYNIFNDILALDLAKFIYKYKIRFEL